MMPHGHVILGMLTAKSPSVYSQVYNSPRVSRSAAVCCLLSSFQLICICFVFGLGFGIVGIATSSFGPVYVRMYVCMYVCALCAVVHTVCIPAVLYVSFVFVAVLSHTQ